MKFKYFNDTNRIVKIHAATFSHGTVADSKPIKPLEERTFILPEGTYPWVKMWDYVEAGLTILVSPTYDDIEENKIEDDHRWGKILELISSNISSGSYEAWFAHTKASFTEKTLTIYCVNVFQRDWLKDHFISLIATTVNEVIGEELDIIVITENEDL
ncbi:DnaA N-terminal domain-containing protein [Oceanobacillus manasiensis]|uniref:DnaA N-terminal domain-containing protein n=1 Tax=Oceanobacillus manasiensis TaxID=586413 RepID=UPI000AE96D20|nr:DnaA N-terminal domain-containing protein [Oceanobacillus manasiensis]